jgi:hypothetical protein
VATPVFAGFAAHARCPQLIHHAIPFPPLAPLTS